MCGESLMHFYNWETINGVLYIYADGKRIDRVAN